MAANASSWLGLPRHAGTPHRSQIATFPAPAAAPKPPVSLSGQSLTVTTEFAEEPPDLPAGGQEEDLIAIIERDRIR
jgi:hypothetical protein